MKIRASTLPEIARKLKARRGLHTQAEVAGAAGKRGPTYSHWERGDVEPGALSLTRVCLFLRCTPNDILLNGKSNPIDDWPDDVRLQLLEISALLIHLNSLRNRGRKKPHPIASVREFLKDLCILMGLQPRVNRMAQARRRVRKAKKRINR